MEPKVTSSVKLSTQRHDYREERTILLHLVMLLLWRLPQHKFSRAAMMQVQEWQSARSSDKMSRSFHHKTNRYILFTSSEGVLCFLLRSIEAVFWRFLIEDPFPWMQPRQWDSAYFLESSSNALQSHLYLTYFLNWSRGKNNNVIKTWSM